MGPRQTCPFRCSHPSLSGDSRVCFPCCLARSEVAAVSGLVLTPATSLADMRAFLDAVLPPIAPDANAMLAVAAGTPPALAPQQGVRPRRCSEHSTVRKALRLRGTPKQNGREERMGE